jgi:hypothetical protein
MLQYDSIIIFQYHTFSLFLNTMTLQFLKYIIRNFKLDRNGSENISISSTLYYPKDGVNDSTRDRLYFQEEKMSVGGKFGSADKLATNGAVDHNNPKPLTEIRST